MITNDGKGSVVIPKGVIALLTLLVALSGCIATVVAYTVTLNGEVQELKENYDTEKIVTHQELEQEVNKEMNQCQYQLVEQAAQITEMQKDVVEIKKDVKELIKNG